MDFYRIQDKMVSREKLMAAITRILELRSKGYSQQETADRLNVDRTFISRLETLGEVRKGQSIAVIGFPILNKDEIQKLADNEGVDFTLLFTEEERNNWVSSKTGSELLNELMDLIARVKKYDAVILLASDYRLRLMKGLLDNEVLTIEIGESPLTEDKWVDPQEFLRVLRAVKNARKLKTTER
ncbi:MAG: transcriptional regulator [Syntrophomonadaceae bacterium]|nr:transcriptional regulator [Syntrophomonadaceae bacterium]